MSNIIKLTSTNITGSNGLRLLNGEVSYSWKNLNTADPSDSTYGAVEVQSNGWENPMLNLTFHLPLNSNYVDGSTFMNWSKWNQLSKNLYDGTDNSKIYLNLTVGTNDTVFTDYSDSTSTTGRTSIPIVVKSYSLRFNPSESVNADFWTINAQLQIDK